MTEDVFTALADPTRRRVLDLLAEHGHGTATTLAAELPVSRPAVSQHLKVLKDVGLVVDRQEGTRRVYQVDTAGLAVLRTYLDQFWERSLASFASAANEQRGEQE